MNPLVIEEINDVSGLGENIASLVGSRPGKLLRFRNAALARAEVNKNRDEILAAELESIAKTLPLMPIDMDHVSDRVVGFYVSAHVDGNAVLTDGVIFANRFKNAAKELANKQAKFSIEADADQAECSLCHGVFATESQYCEHIMTVQAKHKFGAVRILHGLKAVGGGITRNPAGTDTYADVDQMEFIAHMVADTKPLQVLTFFSDLEYAIWSKNPDAIAKYLMTASRKTLPDSSFSTIEEVDGKKIRRSMVRSSVDEPNKAKIRAAQLFFAEFGSGMPILSIPAYPSPSAPVYILAPSEKPEVPQTTQDAIIPAASPKTEVETSVKEAAGITASTQNAQPQKRSGALMGMSDTTTQATILVWTKKR